jgi:hypothetical protein
MASAVFRPSASIAGVSENQRQDALSNVHPRDAPADAGSSMIPMMISPHLYSAMGEAPSTAVADEERSTVAICPEFVSDRIQLCLL